MDSIYSLEEVLNFEEGTKFITISNYNNPEIICWVEDESLRVQLVDKEDFYDEDGFYNDDNHAYITKEWLKTKFRLL